MLNLRLMQALTSITVVCTRNLWHLCNLLYPLTVILIILIKNHLWPNVVSFAALTYPGSNPCWVAASRTAASRYLEVDDSLSDCRGWWGTWLNRLHNRNRMLIPTPLWDCMILYHPNAFFSLLHIPNTISDAKDFKDGGRMQHSTHLQFSGFLQPTS